MLPFLGWFEGYGGKALRGDLLAGVTVAAVLVPQSMAYAMLAGLPPVYGLYAGAVAPIVAALWGSLRQLATGPIAITSLLVLTTLAPMAEPGSRGYIELAFQLSLMVGVIYLAIGALGAGQIMNFVSHAAVRGFTAAAALIIIATQLPALLGIEATKHEYVFLTVLEIVREIPSLDLTTATVGVVSFAAIYGLKRVRPEIPAGLIALAGAAIAVHFLGLADAGVAVIGEIPSGLPRPALPAFDLTVTGSLIGPAFVIAMVSFTETYSVAKTVAAETEQRFDVNQEFIGQGMANLLGAFFQCYPVSGSLSRTAINFSAGARTGLASVFSGAVVVVVLLFLTPLAAFIPRTALAALVIGAVLLLFHPGQVFALWRANRHDGVVAISVFVLALILKPDYALLIGVLVSLVLFLWKTMHPRMVRITRDPERGVFVNAEVEERPGCPQLLHLRSDNAIFFGNAEYTIEHILERVAAADGSLRFVLLDFSAVGFVDVTGIDELGVLLDELEHSGVKLVLIYVHQPVRAAFERAGLMRRFATSFEEDSTGYLFVGRGDAIAEIFAQLDHGYCRETCPHRVYHECDTVK